MLEQEETQRYMRQMLLPELGMEGQLRLKNAKALVVGAGGLGCPVLQYLAAAGVGTIGIIDDDLIHISNLHRQILYTALDLGKKKAEVARDRIKLLNPCIIVNAYPEWLTVENASAIIGQYDLVIDGSDNFPTRHLVNETCISLNKPLVFGSIFRFEGQITVFNYNDGPDYRDLFPELPDSNNTPNCADAGVLGVLPGIVGTLMANEAMKILGGFGEVLSGRLLVLDALGSIVNTFSFAKINKPDGVKDLKNEISHSLGQDTSYQTITMQQLRDWKEKDSDNLLLIDVREITEYLAFNIGDINIPLNELPGRLDEIDDKKSVIFCCTAGIRSRMAAKLYYNITGRISYNLEGGILDEIAP